MRLEVGPKQWKAKQDAGSTRTWSDVVATCFQNLNLRVQEHTATIRDVDIHASASVGFSFSPLVRHFFTLLGNFPIRGFSPIVFKVLDVFRSI